MPISTSFFFTGKNDSATRDLGLLTVVFGTMFFPFLGRFPLIEPDEGRYSEIPREMLERADFITPLLNYVNYFEKPPLLYWLNALSFSLFGLNEFAARFPTTLCGLLTVILTYWLGRRLFDRETGLVSAIIIGTSAGFLVQARINNTDMLLTFCLTLCFGSLILALRDPGPAGKAYYYLFYASAALAVLAKGLVGVLFPITVLLLFIIVRKRWSVLREMGLTTGVPLFLLIVAPWFLLVSYENPDFLRFFFIHEHFERFLTKVHQRYQPIWYFGPILLLTMFPWCFFIPAAITTAWRERTGIFVEQFLFLAMWAGVIFTFFSLSSSKLIPYILPVFPPLSLLLARSFITAANRKTAPANGCEAALIVASLIIGTGIPFYPLFTGKNHFGTTGILFISVIFLIQGLLAWQARRQESSQRFFTVVAVCSALFATITPHFYYSGMAERRSAKPLALKVRELAGPDATVASFGYDQTLPFYARRRIVVIGDRGELAYGSKHQGQAGWFIQPEHFYQLWDSDVPVFVLLRRGDMEELRRNTGGTIRILAETSHKGLATNR